MKPFHRPLPKGTDTHVAIARHPLHPMLVTFPIAFYLGAFASDGAFWFSGDLFWARASMWLLGSATVMGTLAGLAGTIELLWVADIRHRAASWTHFVAAVMLLAVGAINWLFRLRDPIESILYEGIYLSGLGAALVGTAGWLGGKLVFEHQVGVEESDEN
ncbi:DUF2231 domain-containing protein [Alcaligenaceae bacterium A4P071]|nr:DUF2231 domain-containing protein [Alcaligenaceae bacterium B3P038]MDQ2147826.1 DUF2231 domain-containing protein [Alcaligenaceae bacterium C4P045]MDQ2185154.1 DUF2231 domain-containing protein [Alcaligenaceae bacterium A4P071]